MKSVLPLILIVVAGGVFFFQVKPLYSEVMILRAESADYDRALEIAAELETLRADLSNRLQSFSDTDLARLDHFLPSHLDTVKIILDIDGIAARNGLRLKNLGVKDAENAVNPDKPAAGKAGYQSLNVAFTFSSGYEQGVRFMRDLEKSLRILDSANVKVAPIDNAQTPYQFDVTLHAFWLNQ